jgi:hypothetical protein
MNEALVTHAHLEPVGDPAGKHARSGQPTGAICKIQSMHKARPASGRQEQGEQIDHDDLVEREQDR